jgi:transglutaminase-like putative cysteine protease
MKPESASLEDYLVSTDVIDWQTPAVIAKANEIALFCKSDVEKAQTLFEWVRDKIPHSKNIDSDVVTCSASEVLSKGTGICFS